MVIYRALQFQASIFRWKINCIIFYLEVKYSRKAKLKIKRGYAKD